MAVGVLATSSRGYVTINSRGMADPPVINPMRLTNPTDQELAVAGFRRLREYFAMPALRSLMIGEEVHPGPSVTTYSDILDLIFGQFTTFYHASATNKLGLLNDTLAVSDFEIRVIGVDNLGKGHQCQRVTVPASGSLASHGVYAGRENG